MHPIEHGKGNHIKVWCNRDLPPLKHYSSQIAPEEMIPAIPLSVMDHLGNGYMAIISSERESLSSESHEFLVKGKNASMPAVACLFKNEVLHSNMFLMSFNDRDSAQHIRSLLENRAGEVQQLGEIDRLLRMARSLYLPNPERIFFESSRKQQKGQYQEILAQHLPVYHAPKLGEVWGMARFNQTGRLGAVIDVRSGITCR